MVSPTLHCGRQMFKSFCHRIYDRHMRSRPRIILEGTGMRPYFYRALATFRYIVSGCWDGLRSGIASCFGVMDGQI